MYPIFLSEKTFSRQAKLTKKYLVHAKLSLSQSRELLARVYGHKSDHDYRSQLKSINQTKALTEVKAIVQSNFDVLLSRLVELGEIDGQVAKSLLKKLWPEYLTKSLTNFRQHTISFKFDRALWHLVKDIGESGYTQYHFDGLPSLKDSIEAQGIPHTQIAVVLASNEPVALSRLVKPDQEYQVLAAGSEFRGKKLTPTMPQGEPRFLLDINLGRLARHLRMLGFDTLLPKENIDDAYLAEEAAKNNRILLSRDKGLLKRAIIKYGYWVSHDMPKMQLEEVTRYYDLDNKMKLFSRCISCNGQLKSVNKNEVLAQLPTLVARDYDKFKQCQSCKKAYWKGSHFDSMSDLIDGLKV